MNSTLEMLYQPLGGLMTYPSKLPQCAGDPQYNIFSCGLGDLNNVALFNNRNSGLSMKLDGAGGDTKSGLAKTKAIAETLERYCSCTYTADQFIVASADELGSDALDLESIPVLSDQEYAYPNCPLIRPDKSQKIRWVKGISLTSQKPLYIPAIMTYLHIPYMNNSERFWLPISTGCAIHMNFEKALINGINEVVERDAISLTWLNELPLRKLEIRTDALPEWCLDYYNRTANNPFIQTYYFDATTDLGIPSIYSLQISEHNRKVAAMVMCTTELDPLIAFSKITREAASLRIALQNRQPDKTVLDQFHEVTDGALYMGHPSQLDSFNFLRNTKDEKSLTDMRNLSTGSDKEDLNNLIQILQEKGHEIFAVDITSDEAKRAGMSAVRVIIPTLQPLSFFYRAQFKGSTRLYDGPEKMGYARKTEEQLNQKPQPFA
ncbi:YcaO-like family protein [Paenibacillus sp. JX-17]|uniref:YcaO-like family protein n=1 Tax=Paenibacillus lacisoli TaxID=3064525 RepID=A0ABT9CJT8_9BACL|nr:YcaO-like family protein [Paenibacillus sp. JX-17]MDO7907931.1 YcaO-like family protein [Paenibacillus sp. JX-17]